MAQWRKIITSGSQAELSTLLLSSVVNAGTDTNKFLVLDSNLNVDFRTGDEVLADIGAGSSEGSVYAYLSQSFNDADMIVGRGGAFIGTSSADDLINFNGADLQNVGYIGGSNVVSSSATLTNNYLIVGDAGRTISIPDATINFNAQSVTGIGGMTFNAGSDITGIEDLTANDITASNGFYSVGNIRVDGTVDGVDIASRNTVLTNVSASYHTHRNDSTIHFIQGDITTVGTVTSGDVSAILPSGTVSSSTQIDHGNVTGLGDDDHTQYYNVSRLNSYVTNSLTTANITEETNLYYTDGRVSSWYSANADHGVLNGLGDDDHTQYYNVSRLNSYVTNSLTTEEIDEVTNLYYTDVRVKTKLNTDNVHSGSYLGTATTTNLPEGTNLYYTDGRVSSWYSSTADHGVLNGLGDDDHTQYYNVSRLNSYVTNSLTTANITEETNLYYTDARVDLYLDSKNVLSGSMVITSASYASNADLLDEQNGTYYLDYNNFTNTPTNLVSSSGTLTDNYIITGDGGGRGIQTANTTVNFNSQAITNVGTITLNAGSNLVGGAGSDITSIENISANDITASNGIQINGTPVPSLTNGLNDRIVTATGTDGLNGEANLTFNGTLLDLTGNMNISSNLSVDGNLDVNGTLTFLNTTNTLIEDKFLLLASGSTTDTDGGIIVQNSSAASGSALYYDGNSTRWATAKNVGHAVSVETPLHFVTTVEVSAGTADPTSQDYGAGEMYLTSDGEVWIYA